MQQHDGAVTRLVATTTYAAAAATAAAVAGTMARYIHSMYADMPLFDLTAHSGRLPAASNNHLNTGRDKLSRVSARIASTPKHGGSRNSRLQNAARFGDIPTLDLTAPNTFLKDCLHFGVNNAMAPF
jgi:hypothetical protein